MENDASTLNDPLLSGPTLNDDILLEELMSDDVNLGNVEEDMPDDFSSRGDDLLRRFDGSLTSPERKIQETSPVNYEDQNTADGFERTDDQLSTDDNHSILDFEYKPKDIFSEASSTSINENDPSVHENTYIEPKIDNNDRYSQSPSRILRNRFRGSLRKQSNRQNTQNIEKEEPIKVSDETVSVRPPSRLENFRNRFRGWQSRRRKTEINDLNDSELEMAEDTSSIPDVRSRPYNLIRRRPQSQKERLANIEEETVPTEEIREMSPSEMKSEQIETDYQEIDETLPESMQGDLQRNKVDRRMRFRQSLLSNGPNRQRLQNRLQRFREKSQAKIDNQEETVNVPEAPRDIENISMNEYSSIQEMGTQEETPAPETKNDYEVPNQVVYDQKYSGSEESYHSSQHYHEYPNENERTDAIENTDLIVNRDSVSEELNQNYSPEIADEHSSTPDIYNSYRENTGSQFISPYPYGNENGDFANDDTNGDEDYAYRSETSNVPSEFNYNEDFAKNEYDYDIEEIQNNPSQNYNSYNDQGYPSGSVAYNDFTARVSNDEQLTHQPSQDYDNQYKNQPEHNYYEENYDDHSNYNDYYQQNNYSPNTYSESNTQDPYNDASAESAHMNLPNNFRVSFPPPRSDSYGAKNKNSNERNNGFSQRSNGPSYEEIPFYKENGHRVPYRQPSTQYDYYSQHDTDSKNWH